MKQRSKAPAVKLVRVLAISPHMAVIALAALLAIVLNATLT
jgi:hypothetical protein